MTNNDILRKIRYIFDYSDAKMIDIFKQADDVVTRAEISDWMKKDDHEDYKNCSDKKLAIFLNGLINEKRGKKEGEQPKPESRINNNIIFRKLKIALDLKSDDIIEILQLADLKVSSGEISSFFRKKGHKNYRECKDQILRNFLYGIEIKFKQK